MSIGSYAIVIDGDLIESSYLDSMGHGIAYLRDGNDSYVLFESDETAEDAATERWRDMAANDPEELIALVGEDEVIRMWTNGISFDDYIEDAVSADGEFGGGNCSLDVTGMLEYVKGEWPELAGWIDEQAESCGGDYSLLEDVEEAETEEDGDEDIDWDEEIDDDDDDVFLDVADQNRVVELLKGWQEVVDEIGYEPTIAYKN